MSGSFGRELLRRALALAGLSVAVCSLAGPGWPLGIAAGLAGMLAYALLPRPVAAPGEITLRPLQAVLLPDLLGMALAVLLIALPVWIGGGGLHPAALMLWPMAGFGLWILVIAAMGACFGLALTGEALVLRDWRGRRSLPWGEISGIEVRSRNLLPRWLRRGAGVFVAMGQPAVGGALMLARDSAGLVLRLRSGGRERLPLDGLGLRPAKLRAAIRAHLRQGETAR